MKKRLLSMLMAVLMIASLVPATALAADADACNHANVQTISIKKDAAAKQPGVEAKVCADCGKVISCNVTAFAKYKEQCEVCKTPVTVEVQKATCDKVGLSVTYCSTCGKDMGVAAKGTAALKHDYKFTVVNAPVCEDQEDGWGYAVCTRCGNPEFIGDANDAANLLVANGKDKLKDAKLIADTMAMFAAVEHKDGVVVAANVLDKDGKTVLAKAAKAATHVETVTVDKQTIVLCVALDKDGKATTTFINNENNVAINNKTGVLQDGTGYTGDKLCPVCNDISTLEKGKTVDDLNVSHKAAMKVLKAGYLPGIDKDKEKYDGVTDTVYCAECNKTYGGVVIPYDSFYGVENYKIGDTKITKEAVPATCEKVGYTAEVSVLVYDHKDPTTGEDVGVWKVMTPAKEVEALGHDLKAVADVPATCEKYGVKYIGVYECARKDCDKLFDVNDEDITASVERIVKYSGVGTYNVGSAIVQIVAPTEHAWNNMVLVAPTCYSNGLTVVACKDCGIVNEKLVAVTKPVAHVAADELANVVEATCTEAGYSGDQVCKWCGEILKKGEEVPALGHKTEVKDAKAATCTEAGYTGDEVCTVCGETVKKGTEIPALGHKFENGVCTVCGAADPDYVAPVVNPFKDVEKTSPYYDAIIWAADKGITTGKTADTFGIDDGCTRAQIVTFLYRAAGSPEVKADTVNPFTDVSKDSVYYNAILWAVEKGITKGTTETTFDPNAVCTRGQIVTFLFRASGDEKVATGTNFADVAAGSYCADAVAWAVANKVANGFADGTFRPEATCTRGQAVTFIYRALAE